MNRTVYASINVFVSALVALVAMTVSSACFSAESRHGAASKAATIRMADVSRDIHNMVVSPDFEVRQKALAKVRGQIKAAQVDNQAALALLAQ